MIENRVRLISMTMPLSSEFSEDATPNDLISYTARVSNPSNQKNFDTSEKLLRYCIDHKHWSIFQMVDVTLEIITTRDIARQILRHRSFKFQEFSQRYANPTESLGFEYREARLQDTKNRQNSIDTDDTTLQKEWQDRQLRVVATAQDVYNWAINNGIAKEQARSVLPEGNTLSKMYMKGDLRDWLHYCELRTGEETQKEHREIARQCYEILCEHFPFMRKE